jgi:hypothetical protein
MKLFVLSLSLSFCLFFPGLSMAASAPEQNVANGMNTCIQNFSSCVNMQKIEQAWKQGMAEAGTAVSGFASFFQQVFSGASLPKKQDVVPPQPPETTGDKY